jgi:hypothetical protein
MPTLQRLRVRNPLPRSPLFRSYNPRPSPEGIRSVGLAPQVSSPGTPGVLFSQPARRSRDYRLRTSAFSLEGSKKSSPTPEDFAVSELDSRIDLSLPTGRRKRYDAMFQSSDEEVSHHSSPPEHTFDASGVTRHRGEIVSELTTNSVLAPHSLQLPPPFSTSSRNGSAHGSLPAGASDSTESSPRNLERGDADGHSTASSGLTTSGNIPEGQGVHQSPGVSERRTEYPVLELTFSVYQYYSKRLIGAIPSCLGV